MRDFSLSDTIAAIATPPGEGALAIVRLSGKDAISIADKVFQGKASLNDLPAGSARFGKIVDTEGSVIDEVIAVVMKNPHSYTGEDSVEITCHGGYYSSSRILQALLQIGARQAERGEFTLRAFLNNRIDLTQAEAVTELVSSRGEMRHRIALEQLSGKLHERLRAIIEELKQIVALVELGIDFAEEDIEIQSRHEVNDRIRKLLGELRELAKGYRIGKVIREGYQVAIAGKVNVGKSSLLNMLLDMERAIVTEIPGTTRDSITETITVNGLEIHLTDTAGMRDKTERVESIGIERAGEIIASSDLILLMFDPTAGFDEDDKRVVDAIGDTPKLTVLNKCDLLEEAGRERAVKRFPSKIDITISAKTGENIEELKQSIYDSAIVDDEKVGTEVVITNRRHYQCALTAITELENAAECKEGSEFLADHLRAALNKLGEITGEVTTEDILNSIFDEFCIGK
ncbi:MAG: tRNA uridine-5-carboxymethylaminomethyl(34) synthesis GTPase MnmE [candidate division Zixibacteria bacterium]|nr:tRNA uridine-5-carboxymethylaminomethyl(34) synthesis GTPase MnmE [candidate division Zixibacteria bacterium]